MIAPDFANFSAALVRVLKFFERPEPSAQLLEEWFEAMKDLSLDDVKRGFELHRKFGRYAPRPADVRKRVLGSEEAKPKNHGDSKCSYRNGGTRCPLVGHEWEETGKAKLCVGHHELRADKGAGARFLQLATERRVPWCPSNGKDVMVARHMLGLKGQHAVRECFGDAMVAWLAADPKRGTDDPEWRKQLDIRALIRAAVDPQLFEDAA